MSFKPYKGVYSNPVVRDKVIDVTGFKPYKGVYSNTAINLDSSSFLGVSNPIREYIQI